MLTHSALTRHRRQMHRRIRAAVTARRISAAISQGSGTAEEPPPTPEP